MKRALIYFMVIMLHYSVAAQNHPALISQAELTALAASSEWNTILQFCNNNLNSQIEPGWAGWDFRIAIENYARAYQVLKTSDPATANNFAKKALAIMKATARHHNMGGPENTHSLTMNYQFIGLGNGSQTAFTLPFTQLAGTTAQVILSDTEQTTYTYTSNITAVEDFDPILKISNTSGGPNDYASSDYHLKFRHGYDVFRLVWLNSNHPAQNAQYYVTYYDDNGTNSTISATAYSISGTTLTFTTAPAAGKAVFVRMIGPNYEQTGNHLGGVNSVQPDGPGYQMRTFNVGLAYGFDLLYNHPDYTTQLKNEFVQILNDQIAWYEEYGYENDGDLGNYFIRGLYTGVMFTAYGTEGSNPNTADYKTKSDEYTDRIFNKLKTKLPSGFGPQGQYANGTITDILQVFTIYQNITGENLLAQLEWTSNVIPAIIHGTKPNRTTFYDGGDWDQLPAQPLVDGVRSFLKYLPNHANSTYAKQFLADVGASNIPTGTRTDYKTSYPLAFHGKISGPVYTRSTWANNAVWASFAAGEIIMDHIHRDQGHVTIQRGADYLLIDGGGYGDVTTDPYHNSILIDDRAAGDISTYPPGQGAWGFDRVRITRFENTASYTYSAANITSAYARHHDGVQNSVKLAFRSFLFIRPQLVIIHDKIKTGNVNVKKIFNCNYAMPPTIANGVYTVTKGASKLFHKPIVPSTVTPVITSIPTKDANFRNSQITVSGQLNHSFLNVFEATASSATSMAATNYVDAQNMEGVEITAPDSTWVALFAKTDTLVNVDVLSYSYSKTGAQRHLIADLEKNYEYEVTAGNASVKVLDRVKVTSTSQGTISFGFTAPTAGIAILTKLGAAPPTIVAAEELERKSSHAFIANNQLHISWYLQHHGKIRCKVFNLDGRLMAAFDQSMAPGENHTLHNFSQFPSGMYIIHINDNKKVHTFKIAK
jgi:hypothetical protein